MLAKLKSANFFEHIFLVKPYNRLKKVRNAFIALNKHYLLLKRLFPITYIKRFRNTVFTKMIEPYTIIFFIYKFFELYFIKQFI